MASGRVAVVKWVMPRAIKLPAVLGTSALLALGSAVALAAQALLGLAMLRWFVPEAAGRFAVVAQVAFFWMTLALAQSPLTFLADTCRPPVQALRAALGTSALRWLALAPVVTLALYAALPEPPGLTLIWAAGLSLGQMLWYLAQPWALRTATARSAAAVRAAPALWALGAAIVLAPRWPDAHALLWAAASGYALGALWLVPALRPEVKRPHSPLPSPLHSPHPQHSPRQGDDRSTALRLAHTLVDAVTGAALLLVWQRLHGMAHTSYLAVLLRLLGFMPTLVHAAWAQVLLARAHRPAHPMASLAVGLGAALLTALGGALGAALIAYSPWASAWHGLTAYIVPLVLWQGGACVFAALSYRPFQTGQARRYTYAAIAVQMLQLAVLCWPLVQEPSWGLWDGPLWSAQQHLWYLASTCGLGLLLLGGWMYRLKML